MKQLDSPGRANQSLFAVLGLLSLCPMSGYQLRKLSEGSIQHFWREGYGQIYPSLKELERRGWATRQVEEGQGRPDRQVYSLTGEGRAALAEWLEQPIRAEVPRVEILLKLFFGRQGRAGASETHLREYQRAHRELLDVYAATEAHLLATYAGHPDLPYWRMTLNYGRHRSRALCDWCEESLRLLEEPGTRPSGAI